MTVIAAADPSFFTDLGFRRGKEWYSEVDEIVGECIRTYGVSKKAIFMMIGSCFTTPAGHVFFLGQRRIPTWQPQSG